MSLKIIKASKIDFGTTSGLEVEIEIDGELKTECFTNYDEFMQEENGEKRFITKIKENNLKSKAEKTKIFKEDQEQKEKKTELKEYKNQVIG